MKKVAELKKENNIGPEIFTPEERNLFSVAYKNVIGTKRTSHRQAVGIEVIFISWSTFTLLN